MPSGFGDQGNQLSLKAFTGRTLLCMNVQGDPWPWSTECCLYSLLRLRYFIDYDGKCWVLSGFVT